MSKWAKNKTEAIKNLSQDGSLGWNGLPEKKGRQMDYKHFHSHKHSAQLPGHNGLWVDHSHVNLHEHTQNNDGKSHEHQSVNYSKHYKELIIQKENKNAN